MFNLIDLDNMSNQYMNDTFNYVREHPPVKKGMKVAVVNIYDEVVYHGRIERVVFDDNDFSFYADVLHDNGLSKMIPCDMMRRIVNQPLLKLV